MAIRRIIVLEDDLDASAAEEKVPFSLDGTSYEIDLNKAHADELRAVLRPYAEAGRKTSPSRRKNRAQLGNKGGSAAQIRAWAQAQGLPVNSRGLINREVLAKYEAAH
jgi:hypothetical protein